MTEALGRPLRGTDASNAAPKTAENALKIAEARFQSIYERALAGIAIIDWSGHFEQCNPAFCALLGYAEEELTGRHFGDILHPEDREGDLESGRRLRAGEASSLTIESRYVHKSGRPVWVDKIISTLPDETGKPSQVFVIAIDITERKAAEAALKAELADAEELHKISMELMQEQHPQALYERIIEGAARLMRSEGASIQEYHAANGKLRLLASRGFHPASAAYWEWVCASSRSSCSTALGTGAREVVADVETCAYMTETQHRDEFRRSGLRSVQSTPLISRDGRRIGIISTHWREPHIPSERELRLFDVLARQAADLIERSQTEARLRDKGGRLRLALDAANIGTWRWEVGRGTRSLEWDEHCKALFNVPSGTEITYDRWLELLHREDRPKAEAEVARALDAADPDDDVMLDYRTRRHEGIFWRSVTGRAFFEPDPAAPSGRRAVRLVGTIRDVTDARKAEAERNEREQRDRYFLELETRLRSAKTAAQAVDFACEILGRELGAVYASVAEFTPPGERRIIGNGWFTCPGYALPLKRPAIVNAQRFPELLAGEAVLFADIATDPRIKDDPAARARYQELPFGSAMAMPLLRDEKLKALLYIADEVSRDWTGAEVALARETLDRLWQAVERAWAEEQLHRSEALLRAATDNASVGLVLLDRNRSYLFANRTYAAILDLGSEPLVGKGPAEALPSLYESQISPHLDRAFAGDRVSYELVKLDAGGERHYYTVVYEPLIDRGEVANVIVVIYEVTEHKLAELRIAESEERLRNLGDSLPDSAVYRYIHEANGLRRFCYMSAGIEALNGVQVDDVLRDPDELHRQIPPEYLPNLAEAEQRSAVDLTDFKMEIPMRRTDGEVRWMRLQSRPHRLPDGGTVWDGVQTDITDRKRHEDQVSLLLREVNHRAKNMLALVQAMARQTVAASPGDFIERFGERVRALGASQDLLVKNEWKGVDLEDLIRSQLAHFKDAIGTRIKLCGPSLFILASAAQTIGMAMHELATNAGKYGALSNDQGSVSVGWLIDQDARGGDDNAFVIHWLERDGASVVTPTEHGFGTRVIVPMARMSLEAEVDLDYAPQGLSWRLRCPVAKVLEGDAAPDASFRK